MASDTPQDSHHRKHRLSSEEEEAEKSSKRHKHRHHKHHKHRHRHHRSKKHEEETKRGGDDIAPLPTYSSVPVGDSNRVDDDVEEGEILEEEGLGEVVKRKLESDAESGEIKAVEFRDTNPLVDEDSHPVDEHVGKNARTSKISCGDKSENLMTSSLIGNKSHEEAALTTNSIAEPKHESISRVGIEGHVNGDLGHESRREDERLHEIGPPSRRSGKRKTYSNVGTMELDESLLSNRRDSLSSEGSGEKNKSSAYSPSKDRYLDEVYNRSRSRSHDLDRARSRSQSIIEEEALLKGRRNHEQGASRDRLRGSVDLVRNEERERSSTFLRYLEEDRHRSRETWDRDRSREREIDREQKKEKEREGSRNREIDVDWRREKERVRSRDWEMGGERRWETERERSSRDMDMDPERRREKERDRSWDREADRERRREKERDQSRDRGRDREREREKDRNRDRDRVRGHSWERERERRNDRNGDRGTDIESDREKFKNLEVGYGDRDKYKHSRHSRSDETENYWDRTRRNDSSKARSSYNDSLEGTRHKLKRDEKKQNDFEEKVAFELAEQEEEDLNRIKEESRKRRQAILEKYKNQQVQQRNESSADDKEKDNGWAGNPDLSVGAAIVVQDIRDDKNDGVDIYVADPLLSVGKSPPQNGIAASDRTSGAAGLGEGTPKSERSHDMFRDDIFGESPAGVRKSGKDGLPIVRSGLHDNWDDAEGYYSYRFGEILDGRYEVIAAHGKGVFSTVVRAKDRKAGNGEPEEVAIKIIRNNETMHKAGQTEVQILKNLATADLENKRHCVRFLSSFKYRNHLCLVFESLHMNLREVLKKFGRNIGLKLTAVRAYAKQLFIALKHLKNCGVLHCDIKPDNMLVNEAKNVLKICDFGNAMSAGKNEITPYLVSRFYRAPEIILGLTYDHPMDMWSVGCCLYELYTGKVLFPGPTNNDMLRLHMELKGPFPKKMLRKGAFTDQNFDQDLNFHSTEEDPVTKKIIKRIILNIKPKDIGSIISSSPGEDAKMLANFKDLLEKIFVLDPEKRMTVSQALAHPFITVLAWLKSKGVIFGQEYSLLAILSVECTVSIDICHCFEAILQCLDA